MLMVANIGIKMENNMIPVKIKYSKDYIIFYFNDNIKMIKYAGGSQIWYKNDKRHRDNDMPAVIYVNGKKFWYKNGVWYDPNKD